MTTVNYKDLDHTGPYTVEDIEAMLIESYNVTTTFIDRRRYVEIAKGAGLHRVLHGRPNELIERAKLAREITRHLNYHMLKGDLPKLPEDTEEKTESGRVWM